MPSGIYKRKKEMKHSKHMLGKKHSEETLKKMRGRTPWNKGVTGYMGENKTSFKKGHTAPTTAFKKGHSAWNKGTKDLVIPWNKGLKMNSKDYPNMGFRKGYFTAQSGSLNNNWKGGITTENMRIRSGSEMFFWRRSCLERDNFTCQKTGQRGGKLEVHHINNFADFPELRFAIDNGITLSKEAHKEFHKKYGRKNNTKEQLEEFLNNNI